LDRRLGGPQNRSGLCGEEKHLAPPGNPTLAVQPVARRDATDIGVIRIPVVSQLHAPTVSSRRKSLRYSLDKWLGVSQTVALYSAILVLFRSLFSRFRTFWARFGVLRSCHPIVVPLPSNRTKEKTPPASCRCQATAPEQTQSQSQVKVTLRPTISRSVSPGFEPHVGLVTGY
jgi:hypothetical protein